MGRPLSSPRSIIALFAEAVRPVAQPLPDGGAGGCFQRRNSSEALSRHAFLWARALAGDLGSESAQALEEAGGRPHAWRVGEIDVDAAVCGVSPFDHLVLDEARGIYLGLLELAAHRIHALGGEARRLPGGHLFALPERGHHSVWRLGHGSTRKARREEPRRRRLRRAVRI